MTSEQAVQLAETGWWKSRLPQEIVSFQLFEDMLCMNFGDFHKAVEQCLGRPVYTHEFAYPYYLQKEFLGEKSAPTSQEMLDLIPEYKKIVITN